MDLKEAIENRTSVRRYKTSVPLDKNLIEYLISLALRAPSPKNRQPWQVIQLTGPDKDHFIALGQQVLEDYKAIGAHYGSLEISLKAMTTASNLLFIFNPYDQEADYHETWERSDIQSTGAFIEHILLGAKAKGLGSLWINDVFFMQDECKKFLGIVHDIQAIVALGIPDDGLYPRPRKDLDQVLIKN